MRAALGRFVVTRLCRAAAKPSRDFYRAKLFAESNNVRHCVMCTRCNIFIIIKNVKLRGKKKIKKNIYTSYNNENPRFTVL